MVPKMSVDPYTCRHSPFYSICASAVYKAMVHESTWNIACDFWDSQG